VTSIHQFIFTNPRIFLIARLARSDPRNHFVVSKLSLYHLLKFLSISSSYDLEQV
jgi:hypothetical protein